MYEYVFLFIFIHWSGISWFEFGITTMCSVAMNIYCYLGMGKSSLCSHFYRCKGKYYLGGGIYFIDNCRNFLGWVGFPSLVCQLFLLCEWGWMMMMRPLPILPACSGNGPLFCAVCGYPSDMLYDTGSCNNPLVPIRLWMISILLPFVYFF